jgi:acetoin utilization deacetylase AcuC-like enzyme
MKIAWHKTYAHPLPENHKFPMKKYNLIKEELLSRKIANEKDFLSPNMIIEDFILLTHSPEYWNKLNNLKLTPKELRVTGFPQEQAIIDRERYIMEGTKELSIYALEGHIGLNIAGGTHHSFTNKGEGFCLLNDHAIATNYLIENKLAKKVLILDLDVHQGNGTAEIFRDKTIKYNSNVFTFSMHGKNNYPLLKEKSDLDIELEDRTDDNTYISLLREYLKNTIENFKPDFIQYQAGVDILATDKFGKLAISLNGCKIRDEVVFETAYNYQIPIVCTMGGGYSPDINDIIEAHLNTFQIAKYIFG